MKKLKYCIVILLLAGSLPAWGTLVTFDDLAVNTATPNLMADGVNISFINLMTIAEGSTGYGFGTAYGTNRVSDADRINFSGNILTALDYGTGLFRTTDYVRSIQFDTLVSDVEMYIADIDAGQGVWLNALDADNNILDTISFDLTNGNYLLRHASFAGLSGISSIQIIGNDPIGIDNLSFIASVPEPSVVILLMTGLVFLRLNRRRTSRL